MCDLYATPFWALYAIALSIYISRPRLGWLTNRPARIGCCWLRGSDDGDGHHTETYSRTRVCGHYGEKIGFAIPHRMSTIFIRHTCDIYTRTCRLPFADIQAKCDAISTTTPGTTTTLNRREPPSPPPLRLRRRVLQTTTPELRITERRRREGRSKCARSVCTFDNGPLLNVSSTQHSTNRFAHPRAVTLHSSRRPDHTSPTNQPAAMKTVSHE